MDKFHGNQLLYIGWGRPPAVLRRLRSRSAGDAFRRHHRRRAAGRLRLPDFAQIDWSKASGFKSSQPWQPDVDKSLPRTA